LNIVRSCLLAAVSSDPPPHGDKAFAGAAAPQRSIRRRIFPVNAGENVRRARRIAAVLYCQRFAPLRANEGSERMRVTDGLGTIRERLAGNNAIAQTLSMVDNYLNRAQGTDASAPSLTHLVRMLMRTPEAHKNSGIYNDLALLEEQLNVSSAAMMAERAREEAKPIPKDKKFYKAERAREQAIKDKAQ